MTTTAVGLAEDSDAGWRVSFREKRTKTNRTSAKRSPARPPVRSLSELLPFLAAP
jgi:hypothetical protein